MEGVIGDKYETKKGGWKLEILFSLLGVVCGEIFEGMGLFRGKYLI